eukprot:6197021-Pleurochrysis_carterae.AAC.1
MLTPDPVARCLTAVTASQSTPVLSSSTRSRLLARAAPRKKGVVGGEDVVLSCSPAGSDFVCARDRHGAVTCPCLAIVIINGPPGQFHGPVLCGMCE